MADEERGEAASEVLAQFHSLVEVADRKFARVRDLPPTARGALHLLHCRKVFKAYTRLWQFQQHRRRELVAGGLRRWEIGDIASRIGQLYYGQYQRTSEVRFLLEAYVFYEAIVSRGYFEAARASAAPDLKLRYKELRFQARFFIVALLLNRTDEVRQLADRFRALVEESKAAFPCKLPCPCSQIKFAELSLDTYRMVQCLEWEPSGSSYQLFRKEPYENGAFSDQSGASGLIDINLAADLMDPDLPPNPRKAVIYHPSVSQFLAVSIKGVIVFIFCHISFTLFLGSSLVCFLSNLQTMHGAERGEASALLLSHEKPLSVSETDLTSSGSQFTYFLTAPLQAFCQLVGLSSDVEAVSCLDAS
ncbi:hypothetical protein B296_00039914 [Ensete ventricosum]|uniref:Uncharacterized protein n=1 Tax=Ensete ventricosum TaxID=4639 RepID=A0A426ZSA8_ENSVE|nr:hypothetical protein B296_00039914 [Ensete ventricosum]